MSPIKGLTESRRLPRLGKIHLGIKKQSAKSGAWYPSATNYFVVPSEVAEVVGDIAVKGAIPLTKNKFQIQIIKALIKKAILVTCQG